MAHRDKYNEVEYCNGKRAYDKKTAITACNKRFKEDHTILRIYECEYGPHWHLTKQLRGTKIKVFKKRIKYYYTR